jgi:cyclophilin family peptidyl-prolyl cis-trans isomerase
VGTEKRARQKANRQARLDELAKQQRNQTIRRRALTWGGLIALFVVAAVVISTVFGGSDDDTVDAGAQTTIEGGATTPPDPSATTGVGTAGTTTGTATSAPAGEPLPCPPTDGSAAPTQTFPAPPPTCIDPAKTYTAEIVTSKGPITVELDAAAAPLATNSFVYLARYHFFDGTPCHRIIAGFVVQCGDPTGTGTGGPGYTFDDELPDGGYEVGDLAMANSGPNTNGSQFFIISGDDGAALPPSYTRFGHVTEGLDTTVTALDAVAGPDPSGAGDPGGIPPAEPVTIESVTITES